MTINAPDFWDRVAPSYSKQSISDPETYARKLAVTQSYMRPDMQVLELGCGTGSTALEHAPHVLHVDATDVSSVMLDIGREKAVNAGINNVSFSQSGVEGFTGEEGSYDMVLALNLLHLVPDYAAAIAKIYKLLKPGGMFISSTVCLADRLWYLRPVIPVMQWIGKAPYVSFLSSQKVLDEVVSAGFIEHEQWTHGLASSLFLVAEKSAVTATGIVNEAA